MVLTSTSTASGLEGESSTEDDGTLASEAAILALEIGSAVSGALDLCRDFPLVAPVLKTLSAIRGNVDAARSNADELASLRDRCTYLTACVVIKWRCNGSSEFINLSLLGECVARAERLARRCGRRGRLNRFLLAERDQSDIKAVHRRLDSLMNDMGVAGIVAVEDRVNDLNGRLHRFVIRQGRRHAEVMAQFQRQRAQQDRYYMEQKAQMANVTKTQQETLQRLPKPPARRAKVPSGTPIRQSWYVKREVVVETACRALHPNDQGPRLVGLLGDSGSGKTTVAAELVRSAEVLELFSDGVLWMAINNDAGGRQRILMQQLARLVHEDIMGGLGPAPTDACDGAAYVRECMEAGNDGRGLRCLVVADNVWEAVVLAELRQTGMAVLITTRNEGLVEGSGGVGVRIDTMSEEGAQAVLRGASEIPPGVTLPEAAMELIELCDRVAMDLALVGSWKTIRGRKDQWAWSNAVAAIRAQLQAGEHNTNTTGDNVDEEEARTKRRGAVFHAGFGDLGTEDRRVQELYLALGAMPDSSHIGADDAAVLLYGRKWGGERDGSEEARRAVLGVLERWSIIRETSLPEGFQMHDAHSAFAREALRGTHPDVLQPALRRWVKHLSSRQSILGSGMQPKSLEWWVGGELLMGEGLGIGGSRRGLGKATLPELWRGVELVDGDSWKVTRPYGASIHRTTGDDGDYIISVANRVAICFVEEGGVGGSVTAC